MRVLLDVTRRLRRISSITSCRWRMSRARSHTRASGSPAMVNTAWVSGCRIAVALMSSTLALPRKRSSVNASMPQPSLA